MQKVFSLTLALIAATGCKKTQEGKVQSLDNLSGTKKVINSCHDGRQSTESALIPNQRIIFHNSIAGSLTASDKQAYETEVKKYFSAIPKSMQEVFLRLNGQVLLTPNTESICGASFNDPKSSQYLPDSERSKIESCFVYIGQTSAASQRAIQDAVKTGAPIPAEANKEYFVIVHKVNPSDKSET